MAERRLHYKIRGEVGRKRSWAAVAKHRMMEIRNILVEVEDREKNALESANKAMHTLRGPCTFPAHNKECRNKFTKRNQRWGEYFAAQGKGNCKLAEGKKREKKGKVP